MIRNSITAMTVLINIIRKLSWRNKRWLKVIPILSCWWVLFCSNFDNNIIIRFMKMVSKWESSNGLIWTINHVKLIRNLVTKWICGEPVVSSSNLRIKVKTDSTGWPSCINFMKPQNGDINSYRVILTLLTIIRCFEGGSEEDLDPITIPWKGSIRESIYNYCKPFSRRIRRPKLIPWSIHFTTKAGPNGHALASAISDAIVITPDVIEACNIVSPGIGKAINDYRSLIERDPKGLALVTDSKPARQGTEVPARIVSIPAPEGKTRVIAQQGYFVQAALLPLHDALIRVLKSMPQDLTYKQGRGPSSLKIEEGNHFHSLDLKSATDRFPIEIQVRILEAIFGKEVATGWHKLIRIPHFYKGKGYVYGCGQPIGAYSSWCTFTLAHHMVINWCIRRINPKVKQCYIILGDDVVISNDKVASEYLKIISEIGVEISAIKSHKSIHSYEIAKRWYWYRKGEYSPFHINAIVSAGSKTSQVYQAVHDSLTKGWMNSHSVSRVTAFMTTAFRTGKTPNYGIWNHNERLATLYDVVAKTIRGFMPGIEMIRTFQQRLNIPVFPALSPSHYVNDGVINNIVVELFTESAEQNGQGNQNIAVSTIIWITDPSIEIPISIDDAKICIPQLGVCTKFEETYMKIQQRVLDFDTLYNGEWDLAIRSLLVPDTTTVFSARKTDVRSIVGSILVKKIAQRLGLIATLINPL